MTNDSLGNAIGSLRGLWIGNTTYILQIPRLYLEEPLWFRQHFVHLLSSSRIPPSRWWFLDDLTDRLSLVLKHNFSPKCFVFGDVRRPYVCPLIFL